MKLLDATTRAWHHAMVYGDPKSGKSTLVSKLALAGYRLDWFSIDNGHEVLRKLPVSAQERINLYHLPDTRDFQVGITTCLEVIKGGTFNLCDNHGQINCSKCRTAGLGFSAVHLADSDPMHIAVFDHVSALAESAMNVAYAKTNPGDPFAKQEYSHHALQGNLMNQFLSAVQHAPFHVVCMAHCLEVEMEDGKKRIVPQIGSREFSRNAGKYFDHIVHCGVSNSAHAFGSKTTYKPAYLTGSRSDVVIEQPGKEPDIAPVFTSKIVQAAISGPTARTGVSTGPIQVRQQDSSGADAVQSSVVSTVETASAPRKTAAEIMAEINAKKLGAK